MVSASSFVTGAAFGLAALLFSASLLKARAPRRFELTLVQLLPRAIWRDRVLTSQTLAWFVISAELATALALVLTPARQFLVVAGLTAGLFGSFFAANVAAFRRGTGCGCFGAAEGRASRAALLRGLGLMVIAGGLAVVAARSQRTPGPEHAGLAGFVVAVAVIFTALAPTAASRLLAARKHILDAEKDTEPPTQSAVPSIHRRKFLKTAVATAGLAVGLSYLRLPVAYANTTTCESRFNSCWSCCGGVWFIQCSTCCGNCYEQCKGGRNCASLSCFSCWP